MSHELRSRAQRHPGLRPADGERHVRRPPPVQLDSIQQNPAGRLVPAGADQRGAGPVAHRVGQALDVAGADPLWPRCWPTARRWWSRRRSKARHRRSATWGIDHRPTCACVADRTRAKQVFVNLLSNAIKYNRSRAARWTVSCELRRAGAHVRVTVQDTGRGPGRRTSWRSCSSPSTAWARKHGVEEGTGIGLVVSKRLVELMGGDASACEQHGRPGQRLLGRAAGRARLRPRAQPKRTRRTRLAASRTPRRHQAAARDTVLCVEDNPGQPEAGGTAAGPPPRACG